MFINLRKLKYRYIVIAKLEVLEIKLNELAIIAIIVLVITLLCVDIEDRSRGIFESSQ